MLDDPEIIFQLKCLRCHVRNKRIVLSAVSINTETKMLSNTRTRQKGGGDGGVD